MHTLVALEAPRPRKGLLRITAGNSFTLKDLPALPPDLKTAANIVMIEECK
jgi:hypothetical protein